VNDLPETTAGKKLSKLLQILISSEGLSANQVSELFHPSFISALGSPEALATILNTWAHEFSPLQLKVDEEASTPDSITAEVNGRLVLTFAVDETEEHLITALMSRPKPRDITSLDEVDDLLEYHGAAGLSAAVILNGEIAWARGWGVTDSSAPSPITPETILQCGSISKPVAALGALQMVDEGLLDLDTDINEMLRSWKVPSLNGWQPFITVRSLLTHTAGLTVWGFPGYEPGSKIPTLVEVLNGEGNTPAIRSEALPGLMWRYSGGGFCVLQQVMIDVSEKAFPDLLRERILEPLGMMDSTFEQPIPKSLEGRAATGHEGGKPVGGRWHIYPEMAAAGLWTTPSDLGRFLLGVAASKSGQQGAVVSEQTANQMLTGHEVAPGMGLGLMTGGTEKTPTFGHGGANAGFMGRIVSSHNASLGLAALSNSNEGAAAIGDLMRFLADDNGEPELLSQGSMGEEAQQGMMRAKPIEHREAAEIHTDKIDGYLGEYRIDDSRVLNVERSGDMISLELEGQHPLPLYAHSEREWVSREIDVRVEFDEGTLRLQQLGRIVEAKKQPEVL
jgi:CubicO group peptidase (beta-lactamase class C family)